MVKVSARTELMTHMVGPPLPSVEDIHSVNVPQGPLIFFVDKSSARRFKVFRPGVKDGPAILDLTAIWKLNAPVKTISVAQSSDGLTYLAFTCSGSTTQSDQVFVTHGISYADVYNDDVWTACLISAATDQPGGLDLRHRILDVQLGSSQPYGRPNVLVTYKRTDSAADVAIAEISSPQAKTFTYTFPSLPSNMDDNPQLKATPGRVNGYEGFFASYLQGGTRTLTFVSTHQNYGYNAYASLVVQQDVRSIHAIPRQDGNTDLVVAGTRGVFFTSADDAQWSDVNPTLLLSGSYDNLRVSPRTENDSLHIWATKNAREFGYVEVSRQDNDKLAVSDFIVLLSGDLAHVSPSSNADASLLRLIYASSNGELRMLERTSADIWSSQPLRLPLDTSSASLEEVPAYVTNITFTDSTNIKNTAWRNVLLTCSSSTAVIVNGQQLTIDQQGTSVTTDGRGRLQVVNPVTSLAAPQLGLANVGHDLTMPKMLDAERKVDVTSAVLGKVLSSDQKAVTAASQPITADEIRRKTFKDAEGVTKNMFDPSTDFEHLATAISSLLAHVKTLPQDGTRITIPKLSNVAQNPWDVLHWIAQQGSALLDLFIRDGHLLITKAGQTISFAIECIEHGLQAASTILEAAGANLLKLMHWVGSLFAWDDIMATQRMLVRGMTLVLNLSDNAVNTFINQIIGHLGSAKRSIQAGTAVPSLTTVAPDSPFRQNNNPDDLAKGPGGEQKGHADGLMNNASVQYIMNKVLDIMNFFDNDSSGDADKINGVLDLTQFQHWFENDLPEILKPVKANMEKVRTDLSDIFSQGGQMTIQDALLHLGGDVLLTFITAIEQIFIYGVQPALHMLVKFVRTTATTGLSVPFFSPLWKKIADTQLDPSLLDLIMLIVAIPVTILVKLTRGSGVPVITDADIAHFLPSKDASSHTTEYSVSDDPVKRNADPTTPEEKAALVQAFLRPVVNEVLITTQAADGAFDVLKARISNPLKKEALMTVLKLFNNISGFPIITQSNPDATQQGINTLRHVAYSIETAFLGWDLLFSWIGANAPKDSSNDVKLAGQIFGLMGTGLMLYNQEMIAWETYQRILALPAADQDEPKNKKIKIAAEMRMAEVLVFAVARLVRASTYVAKATGDKKAIVITNGVFWITGTSADALMLARGIYTNID